MSKFSVRSWTAPLMGRSAVGPLTEGERGPWVTVMLHHPTIALRICGDSPSSQETHTEVLRASEHRVPHLLSADSKSTSDRR